MKRAVTYQDRWEALRRYLRDQMNFHMTMYRKFSEVPVSQSDKERHLHAADVCHFALLEMTTLGKMRMK